MNSLLFSIAAYAVLLLSVLVAAGFLTAALFIALSQAFSVTEVCTMMAGLYSLIGVIGFVILRHFQNRPLHSEPASLVTALQPPLAIDQTERLPGGIIAVGLLLAMGYVAGRSLRSKR
jgi:small-conductance mechanosensitive channel